MASMKVTEASTTERGLQEASEEVVQSPQVKVNGGIRDGSLKRAHGSEVAPTTTPTAFECQIAQELTARMEIYQPLRVLSALLVGSANFLFLDSRAAEVTARYRGVAVFNLLVTSICLALNVYGTAIILLQQVPRIPPLTGSPQLSTLPSQCT
jgi:hypothetical protein